jgi:hypothetical protein
LVETRKNSSVLICSFCEIADNQFLKIMNYLLAIPTVELSDACEYLAASLLVGLFPLLFFWAGAIGSLSLIYDRLSLRGMGLLSLSLALALIWLVLLVSIIHKGKFEYRDELLILGLCGGLCLAAWRIGKL